MWDSEKVYFKNDDYFFDLVVDINESKSSVVLETYIFKPDRLGHQIISSLIKASLRGVKIKVMIDGVGSSATTANPIRFLHNYGIETKVYHPISDFFHLNRRDHRKIVLIDDYVAWVGSQNITSDHLPHVENRRNWYDVGLRVSGAGVTKINSSFQKIWSEQRPRKNYIKEKIKRLKKKELTTEITHVRLNDSVLDRIRYINEFIQKISKSNYRVWLTTPYFVPTRRLIKALSEAARCGVDVRILLPAQSDVFFMPWVADCYYEVLLQSGVKIFEYEKGILHAKYLILDDWILVGSSNLNYRSFFWDLEIDIVVTQDMTIKAILEEFDQKTTQANRVQRDWFNRRSFWRKFLGRVFLLFRQWL